MKQEEQKELAEVICNSLEIEFQKSHLKFIKSIFEDKELNIGVRNSNELLKKKIIFTDLVGFENEETVINDKYKPQKLIPNQGDLYFGSEEIVRFNRQSTFLGVIGKRWLKNETDDEFVEAVIFGKNILRSIDCMLGSVRINNPFNTPQYLAPGTLVGLRKAEFKNTKYLEISTLVEKLLVNDGSGNIWNLSLDHTRYFWNGETYTLQPIYYDGFDEEDFY